MDGAVLAPLVAVIFFFALYPQLALHRSEGSVKAAVASAHAAVSPAHSALASTEGSAP
jgi:NADH:ubiquinone oxidoreductase subunit 4 (subunit M)